MKKFNCFRLGLFIGLIFIVSNNCKKEDEKPKRDPVITWQNPVDIYYGALLNEKQLNATSDIEGVFVYTPTLGVKLQAGNSQTLTVKFTPKDLKNYNTIIKTVIINVLSKKDPEIVWDTPSDIINGTLLSSDQLNAKANVSGKFKYNPDLGSKLELSKTLKVFFTPDDTMIYNSINKTVEIKVLYSDVDGNLYNTVGINSQIWMVENLKTTRLNDGTPLLYINSDSLWPHNKLVYCWYNNDSVNNKNIYGGLYHWYTVSSQKLCPTGWHVPKLKEWVALTNSLGGTEVAGGKLKEQGNAHWNSPNISAANSFGFSALPGGRKYQECFGIGDEGVLWGIDDESTMGSDSYKIISSSAAIDYSGFSSNGGYSVRCIKDK